MCRIVAVLAPVTDHSPSVRGMHDFFYLCYNCPGKSWFTGLAAYWAKLLTLPCGEIMKRRKQSAAKIGIILGQFK